MGGVPCNRVGSVVLSAMSQLACVMVTTRAESRIVIVRLQVGGQGGTHKVNDIMYYSTVRHKTTETCILLRNTEKHDKVTR